MAISPQAYRNFDPEIYSGPQKDVAKISGPQRDLALAGLPYEVKISGPQRDLALAGLPYE